ncbi:hypothetical protein BWZ20_03035 [Winogradskyella sp. J14-2]|uniref:hypothetical protein n=1 Tax=Winogradskyella sp. J14-2 TaxID=1936080 RepID=UPI000972B9FD|nr:hypothetical protein [Winogradskyella sp. J14-2]APY07336.1 hypothetical protein BWZ20_03035 [Winogradskyella sp. J14-2]
MRRDFVLISAVFCFSFSLSQTDKSENLLIVDSLWTKEVFKFPIHFAPKIDYNGFEEAYFPNDWSNQDSLEYWSYAFAWSINGNTVINETTLERDLKLYFDGLMNVVNKDKTIEIPETFAVFLPTSKNNFRGKIRLYNAFHTKEIMILNVLVSTFSCTEQDRTIVLFRFSPSSFEDKIWSTLKRIKYNTSACASDISDN